jgi:hypothetical protein
MSDNLSYWRVPCEMADGTMREIHVQKGSNASEIEKRLEQLEKEYDEVLRKHI